MWAVCLIIPSYRGHPFSEPPSVFPPLPSTSTLHSLQLFTIQTLRKMQRVLCPIRAKMSVCPPAWRCWEHQVGAAPESKQSCLGNNSRGRRVAAVAYLRLWLRNMNLEQHLDFFLILFFVFLQIAGLFFFSIFFLTFFFLPGSFTPACPVCFTLHVPDDSPGLDFFVTTWDLVTYALTSSPGCHILSWLLMCAKSSVLKSLPFVHVFFLNAYTVMILKLLLFRE